MVIKWVVAIPNNSLNVIHLVFLLFFAQVMKPHPLVMKTIFVLHNVNQVINSVIIVKIGDICVPMILQPIPNRDNNMDGIINKILDVGREKLY